MVNSPEKKQLLRMLNQDAIKLVKAQEPITPPLTLDQLLELAHRLLSANPQYEDLLNWAVVFINNALWADIVAAVPKKRKLLLIPQCLKNECLCKAEIDEFGLLCEGCGGCMISDILEFADQQGIMSMVAEGSTMVAELIEGGEVDAIIGVSCFEALEKAFKQMVNRGVPGLALPLIGAGCKNTSIDADFLKEIIAAESEQSIELINPASILKEVRLWFNPENIEKRMGPTWGQAEILARIGLSSEGKRYRPFLFAAASQCFGVSNQEALEKLAIAVECFHKASLIHDDIEDGDELRNGQPTLAASHGMPEALNAGDLLLGEGYRMISELKIKAETKTLLFAAAVSGHLELSRGQGEDLHQRTLDRPPTVASLLEIFCKKTSPAFNVAFQFAAILGEASDEEKDILHQFCDQLGIGYQILDDLADSAIDNPAAKNDPSIIASIMHEEDVDCAEANQRARQMLAERKDLALQCLGRLKNLNLKRLLFQVTHKILHIDEN